MDNARVAAALGIIHFPMLILYSAQTRLSNRISAGCNIYSTDN